MDNLLKNGSCPLADFEIGIATKAAALVDQYIEEVRLRLIED